VDADVLFEETDVKQLITRYSLMTVLSPRREKEQVGRECQTGGSGLLQGVGRALGSPLHVLTSRGGMGVCWFVLNILAFAKKTRCI